MTAPGGLIGARLREDFPRRLCVVELDITGVPDIPSGYYPARDGDGWVTSDQGANHPDVAPGAEPLMLPVTGVRAVWRRLAVDVWELDELRVLAKPPAGPDVYSVRFATETPERWPEWVWPIVSHHAPEGA